MVPIARCELGLVNPRIYLLIFFSVIYVELREFRNTLEKKYLGVIQTALNKSAIQCIFTVFILVVLIRSSMA